MKKTIIIISLLILASFASKAQVRYTYPLEVGIGYSRPSIRDWSNCGSVRPEAIGTHNMLEFYLCGLYGAISTPSGNQNLYRFGFELGRLSWGDGWWTQSLAVTPYYSYNRIYSNSVKYDSHAWGAKIDYSFSIVDLFFMASKQELTFGIAIVLPLYTLL